MNDDEFIDPAIESIQTILDGREEDFSGIERLELLEQFFKGVHMSGIGTGYPGDMDIFLANLALYRTGMKILSHEAYLEDDLSENIISRILSETGSEFSAHDVERAQSVSDELVLFYSIGAEISKEHTTVLFCERVISPSEDDWENTKDWASSSFSDDQRIEILKRREDIPEEIATRLSNMARIRNRLIHDLSGHSLLVSNQGQVITENPEEAVKLGLDALLYLTEETSNPFPLDKISEFALDEYDSEDDALKES